MPNGTGPKYLTLADLSTDPEEDFEVEDGVWVRLKRLNTVEIAAAEGLTDPAAQQAQMLALALVEPTLTPAQVVALLPVGYQAAITLKVNAMNRLSAAEKAVRFFALDLASPTSAPSA